MDPLQVSRIAKALAHPRRVEMLTHLRASGTLTCSQVLGRCPLSQPTISHHISVLQQAGIVKSQRRGAFSLLSIDEDLLTEFARALRAPAASPTQRPPKQAKSAKAKPARRNAAQRKAPRRAPAKRKPD